MGAEARSGDATTLRRCSGPEPRSPWPTWIDAPTKLRQAAALEAVETARAFSGINDDFFVVWLTAAHVAQTAGQSELLAQLAAMVDAVPDPQLSQSLRAGRAHVGALLGIAHSEPPETTEGWFRLALERYEAWGATLFEARCRADFAVWLHVCGRPEEAEAQAAQVRDFYAATGCTQWLTDLEERLAAVVPA